MKEVSIVQRLLPHYRVDFFEGLHSALEKENIRLQLIHGKPNEKEALKKDEAQVNWATKIKNRTVKIGSQELYWQPCLNAIKNSELVIVEQANKNLVNYWLLVTRLFSRKKVAFWGHGRNLQDNEKSLANRFKNAYITSCNWWFAYTQSVKDYLLENKFPGDRITVVNNAINTDEIIFLRGDIRNQEVDSLKENLALNSTNIGIYCGGIYPEKRIPFLIESARLIRQKVPDFNLIVLGSGSDVELLKSLIIDLDWIHYLGPKFAREKITFFKMSKVFLMPGLVGLAILDAFANETPLITTDYPFHSPEIEYLENNSNGVISENSERDYATAVVSVLTNDEKLGKLKKGCRESREKHSLHQMIENYKTGILNCLNYD